MIVKILIAVLIFGITVIIHELGHFLLAKANGITVTEFSIGFGPTVVKTEKGGTIYSLKLLPFGGACQMLGEDGEEVDLKDDDDDDSIYGAGGKALPDDEITMDDDLPNGKDVDADEAADAGFEIQDEDNVFGLLNDSYTMDSDDSENV